MWHSSMTVNTDSFLKIYSVFVAQIIRLLRICFCCAYASSLTFSRSLPGLSCCVTAASRRSDVKNIEFEIRTQSPHPRTVVNMNLASVHLPLRLGFDNL